MYDEKLRVTGDMVSFQLLSQQLIDEPTSLDCNTAAKLKEPDRSSIASYPLFLSEAEVSGCPVLLDAV